MPNVGRHGLRERPVHMAAWDRPSPCSCGPRQVPANIDHWVATLRDQWEVDPRGIQQLRDLAAQHREGYMHANAIIGKLIKEVNDNVPVHNPSAFVSRSVTIANRAIQNAGS